MSSKRFNDGNSHVFDKGGNTNGVGRNGNVLGLQGSKQRTRSTGGATSAKLSVPRPVNLPSLRKESQGHETHPQSTQPITGTTGWQRAEEHSSLETWSHHVAPRQPVGGMYSRPGMEDASTPTLDQEEFPSLEVAAHTKSIAAKMKPRKSTTSPERRSSKEWVEDERPPVQLPRRASWEGDERFGGSGVPMTYATPVYMPMGTQGLPTDPYLHPPYYPRPYFAPSPRTPGQGYRPEYYPPTEGMYPPYMQMYPPPMYAGYSQPEMYGDAAMYPLPPPRPRHMTNTEFDVEKAEVGLELQFTSRDGISQHKAEAEHPRTPDKLSGEGTLILTKRQSDEQLQGDKPVLRKMSLPKDNSLALSRPSEELDWGAQVDAEERANERKEIKILRRPSHESNQSVRVSRTAESEAEPPGWRLDDRSLQRNKRWSHSPLRRDVHRRDASVDASGRPIAPSSDVGAPHTFTQSNRRQPTRPRTLTPPVHRVPRPDFEPRAPEGWRDHRGMPRAERGFGRSFGRGRSPGRGRQFFSSREERQRSPMVRPPGRRLFPGRGFQRSGPGRSFDASEGFNSWKSKREPSDVEHGQSTATIQFGEFDVSVTGNFDPFSDENPTFSCPEDKKHDQSREVDAGVEVHRVEGSISSRPNRRTNPTDMSFVGTVLDEVDRIQKVKTPRSEYGSERGSFIGRSPTGRGRDHRRGGRFPNNRRGRSFGRSGERRSPFTDGGFEYDAFDSGYGYRGHHHEWNRRHSGDNPSFRGRRGWRGDRGGRRGRGRDAGRFQRHQGSTPAKPYQPRMQWVPKKTSMDDDKTVE